MSVPEPEDVEMVVQDGEGTKVEVKTEPMQYDEVEEYLSKESQDWFSLNLS